MASIFFFLFWKDLREMLLPPKSVLALSSQVWQEQMPVFISSTAPPQFHKNPKGNSATWKIRNVWYKACWNACKSLWWALDQVLSKLTLELSPLVIMALYCLFNDKWFCYKKPYIISGMVRPHIWKVRNLRNALAGFLGCVTNNYGISLSLALLL